MAEGTVNPRDVKMALAREMVTRFHDATAAEVAEHEFRRMFQAGGLPDDIRTPHIRLSGANDEPMRLIELLVQAGLVSSHSEGRRLMQQGAVRVNGERVTDANLHLPASASHLLQVGRRRFARIHPENVERSAS